MNWTRITRWVALFAIALLILVAPPALFAQDGPESPGAKIFSIVGTLLGLATVFITGLGKTVTQKIDGTVVKADQTITNLYKKFQPVVATALGYLIPVIWAKTGIAGAPPAADIVVAAPLGTALGITIKELWAHYGPKSF